jgi:hypothetical protein
MYKRTTLILIAALAGSVLLAAPVRLAVSCVADADQRIAAASRSVTGSHEEIANHPQTSLSAVNVN